MMNEVIHYWDSVGMPLCGADGPPLDVTGFMEHVNCPQCLTLLDQQVKASTLPELLMTMGALDGVISWNGTEADFCISGNNGTVSEERMQEAFKSFFHPFEPGEVSFVYDSESGSIVFGQLPDNWIEKEKRNYERDTTFRRPDEE